MKQAGASLQGQLEVIEQLRNDRAKLATVVQEEKKQYEALSFEILSIQTLVGKIKQFVATVEDKQRQGQEDRDLLAKRGAWYQQEVERLSQRGGCPEVVVLIFFRSRVASRGAPRARLQAEPRSTRRFPHTPTARQEQQATESEKAKLEGALRGKEDAIVELEKQIGSQP